MTPAAEGLGVAGSSGSRQIPERALSLPNGTSAARPHRQDHGEEGPEKECATEKLKTKLEQLKGELNKLLEEFRKLDLTSIPEEKIRSILSPVTLCAPCSRPCARCQQFETACPIQFEHIASAQRLFVICILIDDPLLICLLLSKGFNDAKFGACRSEEDLIKDAGISPNAAKALLNLKHPFFRVSIVKYIRSRRQDNDCPQDTERNFVMDEMLDLMGKLEVRAKAGQNGTQKSIRIEDLTFAKSSPLIYDRPIRQCPPSWDDEVSVQSLGFLLLDIIWFLIGGSNTVLRLDKFRYGDAWTVEGVKLTPKEELQKLGNEPKLETAFELAWILVQPSGKFGLSGVNGRNYHWAVEHFHKIWPQMDFDIIQDPEPSRSPDAMSVSTSNHGADGFSHFEAYEEIDAPETRWLFLRCQKEKRQEIPCRVRIWRARSGLRIRFDIYAFEKNPVEHKEYHAKLDGLKFIPLYAFTNTPDDFSAKLQPRSGSTRDINIKHKFIFQSRRDVCTFQEGLTGRKIEADALLDKITLHVRRDHEFRVGKLKFMSKWGDVEKIPRDSGSIQLWRVLEKDELERVHRGSQHLPHATKDYPLRLEIAVFSEGMLVIIRVTSLLKIREWDKGGFGLTITSKDSTSGSMMLGREYNSTIVDDENVYPGLPLFQKQPELPPDGNKVWCQSLVLRFNSEAGRAEIKNILNGTYHAIPVRGG